MPFGVFDFPTVTNLPARSICFHFRAVLLEEIPSTQGGVRAYVGIWAQPAEPEWRPSTAYLWEEVWERESWLEILGRYLVAEKDSKKQITNVIFPRYHQLDATRELLAAVFVDGAGGKYLIQHSAGSGKTNSIAWSAHFLADLHDAQQKKIFDSVVVVSDRNVIDQQLQQAIFDFERTAGVVATINLVQCRPDDWSSHCRFADCKGRPRLGLSSQWTLVRGSTALDVVLPSLGTACKRQSAPHDLWISRRIPLRVAKTGPQGDPSHVVLIGTFGFNFPIFISTMAVNVFHSDARAFGLLSSIMAVGALSGALFAAGRKKPSLASLSIGAGVFGLGCTLAALAPGYWWFAAALAVAGAAALTLANGTNSIMQLSTELSMRGRVMALRVGVALGGMTIGAPIVGWVANHFGPRWALGIGAAACFTAALIAVYVLARRKNHCSLSLVL